MKELVDHSEIYSDKNVNTAEKFKSNFTITLTLSGKITPIVSA